MPGPEMTIGTGSPLAFAPRKQRFSYSRLADMFGIDARNLSYMIKLIERYGLEIVKKGRNNYYSPEIKQEMIDKVLLEGWSKERVSLEYGLPARATLHNWLAQYKKNKYTIVEKTRGRLLKMGRKPNAILKKLRELRLKEEKEKEERRRLSES